EGDKRRRMSTMGVCSSGKHQELPDPLPHTWPRGGRTSLAALHPALAGDPADRLARAAIAERLDTFLGQAARPFLNLLGEIGAFGVGILQGSTKLPTTPMLTPTSTFFSPIFQ